MFKKLFSRFKKTEVKAPQSESERFFSQEFYPWIAGAKRRKIKPTDFHSFVQSIIYTPYIFACVSKKATAIKAFDPKVVRYTKKGEQFEDRNSKLYKLVKKPNPFYGFRTLLEGTVISLELTGNAYWEVNKIGDNIVSLYLLLPQHMFIRFDDKTNSFIYTYRLPNGKEIQYSEDEIIHFKYPNPFDDFYGLSPLASLDIPIETLQESLDILNRYFKFGTHLRGILYSDSIIPRDQKEYLEQRFAQLYSGSTSAFRIPVLDRGMRFDPISVIPKDLQAIEAHEKALYAVLAVFKVPPEVLGVRQANYSGMEQARRVFWEDTILPLAKDIEETINFNINKLTNERSIGFVLDHTSIEALKENRLIRARVAAILMDRGVMTRNEVRTRFFDLAPVEGGDEFLLPLNMMPVESGRKPENEEGNPDQTVKPDRGDRKFVETKSINISKDEWEIIHTMLENFLLNELPKFYLKQKERFVAQITYLMSNVVQYSEQKVAQLVQEAVDFAHTLTAEDIVDKFLSIAERLYFDFNRKVADDISVLTDAIPDDLRKSLSKWAFYITDIVDDTTKRQLVKKIMESEQKQIDKVADEVYKHLIDDISGRRIKLIARTEATYLLNSIQFYVAMKAGYKYKQWNTHNVKDARPSHAELHKYRIKINEAFVVGGEKAMFPADITLSPENRINCKCRLTFHFEE